MFHRAHRSQDLKLLKHLGAAQQTLPGLLLAGSKFAVTVDPMARQQCVLPTSSFPGRLALPRSTLAVANLPGQRHVLCTWELIGSKSRQALL